jgi:hypothetical protein
MAQPTPPPTTQTFFLPSVSVALPRRAYKILQAVALLQLVELLGSGAHGLHDDADGALLGVAGRGS